MITASKRMLNRKESNKNTNEIVINNKNSLVPNRYEAIVLGDAFCGKSTYLNKLAEFEMKSNLPVMVSQDRTEYEFWIEKKSRKAVFIVTDTANQERFRSLTQSYYRKAQCVLLMFDARNNESFNNLAKWHFDVINYCKNCDNDKFAIVLVGLKRKQRTNNFSVEQEQIENFLQQHEYIINYCEIDLDENNQNIKEPFQILFEHFLALNDARILSTSFFSSEKNLPQRPSFLHKNSIKTTVHFVPQNQEIEDKNCCNLI